MEQVSTDKVSYLNAEEAAKFDEVMEEYGLTNPQLMELAGNQFLFEYYCINAFVLNILVLEIFCFAMWS